eukprot:7376289-Prymnesium_polylepis.3
MAIDSPRTRVVTPAAVSINNGGACAEWPTGAFTLGGNTSFRGPDIDGCASEDGGRGRCAWQADLSFLGSIPQSNDFFFHIAPATEPWITHVRDDGYSVIHSHPKKLNGTKFFQWGYDEFGTFNQDFLSASEQPAECGADAYDPWCASFEHKGRYTELQVGPARTQMHTFPVEARGSYEWTEWFKGWQADARTMQASDYSTPIGAVGRWLRSAGGMPQAKIDAIDALLTKMADVPP